MSWSPSQQNTSASSAAEPSAWPAHTATHSRASAAPSGSPASTCAAANRIGLLGQGVAGTLAASSATRVHSGSMPVMSSRAQNRLTPALISLAAPSGSVSADASASTR